ncbi:phytoene/squalene synthase family protein [Corynebacterium atypicum]|uniref:phytoene/squalene synthase family protein n=1 Tax=Corynebacterium atypicum TaxID=191610 RepID=UPI000AC8D017|nr:squalene/phytoene synthase family protein [Corynebacterium atypicum]
MKKTGGAGEFTAMSRRAAAQVQASYSTSFGLATRLLPGGIREDIQALYAVVRIADEIVDAPEARPRAEELLGSYEASVREALGKAAVGCGLVSADPVLHAFARSAQRCGFTGQQLGAFFQSMRADLKPRSFSPDELEQYIYGSAEVIGEMCVQAFTRAPGYELAEMDAELVAGARRLGTGFQRVNFLRDLAFDRLVLGRDYLPWVVDNPTKN